MSTIKLPPRIHCKYKEPVIIVIQFEETFVQTSMKQALMANWLILWIIIIVITIGWWSKHRQWEKKPKYLPKFVALDYFDNLKNTLGSDTFHNNSGSI